MTAEQQKEVADAYAAARAGAERLRAALTAAAPVGSLVSYRHAQHRVFAYQLDTGLVLLQRLTDRSRFPVSVLHLEADPPAGAGS